jgi:hypothetical protein
MLDANVMSYTSPEYFPAEIQERCLSAADYIWDVDQTDVVMVGVQSGAARALANVLQAVGLNVLQGLDRYTQANEAFDKEQPTLVIIPSADWYDADFRMRLNLDLLDMQNIEICIVLGALGSTDRSPMDHDTPFDDVRALLQRAGIGFFSFPINAAKNAA